MSFNKVILMGRLTSDPELKQSQSGVSVTSFSLAVDRRYTKEGQEKQTDFITIVAWRGTAEFISKYFRKGSSICIAGSIQTRSWKDSNGNNRYTTEVVADEAMFVGSKSEVQGSESPTPTNYMPDAYQVSQNTNFEGMETDEDLPFN